MKKEEMMSFDEIDEMEGAIIEIDVMYDSCEIYRVNELLNSGALVLEDPLIGIMGKD